MAMSLYHYLRLVSCPLALSASSQTRWRLSVISVTPFHVSLSAARGLCWVRRAPPSAMTTSRSSVNALMLKNTDLLSVDQDDQEAPTKPVIPGQDRASAVQELHDAWEMQKEATDHTKDSTALCLDVTLKRERNSSQVLATPDNASSAGEPVRNESHASDSGEMSRDNQEANCEVSTKSLQVKRVFNVRHAVPRSDSGGNTRWFPYVDKFRIRGKTLTSSEILQMLAPFLSEERRGRIERAAANRTFSVCPVVEGLSDLGNIAAVFRSAEALGFQSVHVISNETTKRYKKHRKVSMGTEKWLDAELWCATKECLGTLQSRGYRIAVAHVADDAASIFDIDWTVPTAVVFGNENRGISMDALQMSDIRCSIPMEGMVDSFNVSVAAGIVLHHAVHDRITRLGKHGDLSSEEQKMLSADFYLRHNSKTLSLVDWLLQVKQDGKQTSLTSVLRGELEVDIENPENLNIKEENISQMSNP